ncbi:MAG: T9SS type A sorting domain-containing protein [Flavisolibacter sp.]|nr:T9SS type A sorting domain-containing protein [Flavisolibacter sp.]
MKKFFYAIGITVTLCIALQGQTQTSSKSLLINHGGTSCGSDAPEEHFFAGTLTNNPTLISSASIGMPYYNVMASYNPADHKIYYANMVGSNTNIYALDFNFSGSITPPILGSPTYVYNYSLNQLCFDNNGNNYAFYNFDAVAGTAHLAQVDIATGNQIPGSNKLVIFPAGHIPNSVLFGDMVILPNGRMFATFGNTPSQLFEITNITGSGDANAVFLTDLPRTCFSIGFIDGNLTIAGTDGGGCYYYIWDINSFSLSNAFAFPLSKNSADMSNLTLAVGTTKQLVGANSINSTTARVYYQIVVKNKGNIFLNNIQVSDDLGKVFGAANVSNVSLSFASNPANLQLNPNYNGVTDINMLAANQMLNNYPTGIDSFIIDLGVTVTNINPITVYKNSAVATGNIGAGANYLAVSDSSNNGDFTKMDLDGNGVSDDAGENIPTPFTYGMVMATNNIVLQGVKKENNIQLQWKVVTDKDANTYEVQRSFDGSTFSTIGIVQLKETNLSFTDNVSGKNQSAFYYRIKAVGKNSAFVFSNTILVKENIVATSKISPNPFTNQINIETISNEKTNGTVTLRDISGRVLFTKSIALEKGNNFLSITDLSRLQSGTYILDLLSKGEHSFIKLIKK